MPNRHIDALPAAIRPIRLRPLPTEPDVLSFGQMIRRAAMLNLGAALLVLAVGCEEESPTAIAPPTEPSLQTTIWQWPADSTNGDVERASRKADLAAQVAVLDQRLQAQVGEALSKAMERARATAEEARERWLRAPSNERDRWAIKWAAPLAASNGSSVERAIGDVEYVWVRPVHWSPFRIEGVLASEPVHRLLAGAELGAFVNFPIEEMADWVRYHTDNPTGPRDGGFTIDVLEAASPTARSQ